MSSNRSNYDKITLPECDINFDTPNRKEILKNGLRKPSTENLLGRGTFGTVFKAIYKGKQVAVKIINNNNNASSISAVANEFNVLNWEHENIIKILHIESTPTHSAIIMERFQGKCLQSIIDQIELSLQHRFRIAKDIICGLNYCHKNGILHLDIKPQNILIAFTSDMKGDIFQNYSCKICDFGTSKRISSDYTQGESLDLLRPAGTIRYMSPEALKNKHLSPASDIYSYGITMWQLKSRIPPYFNIDCNDSVAYKVVKHNLRPNTPTEDIDNCFQFTNSHHNCLCQHFSSETQNHRKNIFNYFNSFKPSYNMLPLSPFRNLQINSNNKSSKNVKILEEKTFKKSNKKLHFDLKNNFDELQCVNVKENQENYLNLEKIFVKRNSSDCGLKEQLYKTIYLNCWNTEPDARPSGIQIENRIKKFLN